MKLTELCWLESLQWSTVGHDRNPVVRTVCKCGHSAGEVVFPDDTPEARHKVLVDVINEHASHREDVIFERFRGRVKAVEDER